MTIKPLDAMPEVLTKFTGENPRYDLDTPWPDRGWWYATDGAILVGVRVRGAKRGLRHLRGEKGAKGSRCVPDITGLLPDAKKGEWQPWPTVRGGIEGRWVKQYYCDLIAELPGVEYLVDGRDSKTPLRFRWAHGVGAVMGTKHEA